MRLIPLALGCCAVVLAAGDFHFHHVHLNVTDPDRSRAFYAARFDCEVLPYSSGEAGIFAQRSWLLFNKVSSQAPSEITSAIWHIGWGAEDMKVEYARQLRLATPFDTPITELFVNFFFAYVRGPDKELIELNSAKHHRFGHLHLLSSDPVKAGEWYVRHFGAAWANPGGPAREPRFIKGFQIAPMASLMMDNVNVIIFPVEYARQQWPEFRKQRAAFDTPRGRVIDHVALSVDGVAAAAARLRDSGVRVLPGGFVSGPDNIEIELVEGHTHTVAGSDHVGKEVPEFVHGEECLFCHRNNVGQTWQGNQHALTVRPASEPGEFFLGHGRATHRVRTAGYNRFAVQNPASGEWDPALFGSRCAGCHSTAVDPKTQAFAYQGLDCFTCHGAVDLKHSGDTSLVLLSRKRRDPPGTVNSICAQCHLRGGSSASTGLPYPNQYVPGDNLFRDFAVSFALAEDTTLSPADRHVYRSARDAALGLSEQTCLDCHSVHAMSSQRHRKAAPGAICNDCHLPNRPKKEVRRYEVHSATCQY